MSVGFGGVFHQLSGGVHDRKDAVAGMKGEESNGVGVGTAVGVTLLPKHRRQLLMLANRARNGVTSRFQQGTRRSAWHFWLILIATAILSSFVSWTIDQATFTLGTARSKFTSFERGKAALGGVIVFDVCLAILARVLVRTTPEAEGSGFPEVKAMLFGKSIGKFLSIRVLVVKALALTLGIGSGLPLGKEGPNVHMAACISHSLGPDFFLAKRSRNSFQGVHLLLAACAVGVGSTFGAPIGGMIFALELVLPQVFDGLSLLGCFLSAIVGATCFAFYRSWASGAQGLHPLMSTNLQGDEGADSPFPALLLMMDVALGVLCGAMAGLWIRSHKYMVGMMKRWRLGAPLLPKGSSNSSPNNSHPLRDRLATRLAQSLLDDDAPPRMKKIKTSVRSFVDAAHTKCQWRDLFQITVVVALNTILAAGLPFLHGRPQPALLSELFNKELLEQDSWVVPALGPGLSMFCCFLMKWTMTILALCLPNPAGVVAPTMIIGGLLGRSVGMCIPDFVLDTILPQGTGAPGERAELHGAFLARFAVIGAASFCSGVCRAFAMAISVFEVLDLNGSILPLSCATLAAMLVADRLARPFFDTNLMGRGLGGITELTQTRKAMEPAFTVMRRVGLGDCLRENMTVAEIERVLDASDESNFAIILPLKRSWSDCQGVLKGSITRSNVEQLLEETGDGDANAVVNFSNAELQRPSTGKPPVVSCVPLSVLPETRLQDVYLLMKMTACSVVYVCQDNILLGEIKWKELLGHKLD